MSPSAKRVDRAALIACLLILGFTVLYPTLRMLAHAVSVWSWDVVGGGAGREAIVNTLFICFASVLTSGVLGTAIAVFVSRVSFPGRKTLGALAYLPFAMPPLVGTLSFYYLLGPDGLIPRTAHEAGWESFDISGPAAVLIVHTYSFCVFFYAMTLAALEGLDPSQVEAARTLGATPWRAFRKVTLPQLSPALVGASLLTFMSSGASYSAPAFLAPRFPYLSVQIVEERVQARDAEAATLTVLLAAVSLAGLFVFRTRRATQGSASKGTPRRIRSGSVRALAGIAAWTGVALFLAPHLVILLLSFVDHRQWFDQLIPQPYTLSNYTQLFNSASAFAPARNSLWMSAIAAMATLAAGLPAAYLIGRGRIGARWVNILVMIPWALPGTVVAMNLIIAFNDRWLPLHNTIFLLPLAYFVRFIPLLTRMATAAVSQFDATLLEAGRSLGASPLYCFRRIVLPLLAPALVASTALVFASSLGEYVATILLYTPSNLPISIQISMAWRGAGIGAAFAYSALLSIVVAATFLFARRLASRTI